jgi:hypothetical protein
MIDYFTLGLSALLLLCILIEITQGAVLKELIKQYQNTTNTVASELQKEVVDINKRLAILEEEIQ